MLCSSASSRVAEVRLHGGRWSQQNTERYNNNNNNKVQTSMCAPSIAVLEPCCSNVHERHVVVLGGVLFWGWCCSVQKTALEQQTAANRKRDIIFGASAVFIGSDSA